MAYDAQFIEGFDKYGPAGRVPVLADFAGEWTNQTTSTSIYSLAMVAALSGSGYALQFTNTGSLAGVALLSRTLGGNYARLIGGRTVSSALQVTAAIVTVTDGGTAQYTVTLETSGKIGVRSGGVNGSLVATSSQVVAANSVHCVEYDLTIHNTAGAYSIWLDGVLTSLNAASVNTRGGTSNNYFNGEAVGGLASNSVGAGAVMLKVDHSYSRYFLASGSGDTPALNNPVVETDYPTADSAVQFTAVAGVLGQAYSATTNTNAPGANRLSLRRFVPGASATINSVSIMPQATSATAKFKGVIYADSAGNPGSLLSSGTEVVSASSGSLLTLALVTPQALSAGTPYWIGYITDTSVAIAQIDTTTTGQGAANTYASGAPGSAPAMTTGLPSWEIFGNCTGIGANWQQVANSPPLGDLSYNQSSTSGQEDLFTFTPLSVGSQTIVTVAVKAMMMRSDAGARTVDLRMKSSSTDDPGSAAGQAPAMSYGWLSSYWDLDPNGGVAWTKTSLDAAKSGVKIAS